MTVQMTLGVQSFCVGDGHFSAVKHNPTVGKCLEAIWQGCLVLNSGGDVVFHHADIQNVIQCTADGGEDVGDCGTAAIKPYLIKGLGCHNSVRAQSKSGEADR